MRTQDVPNPHRFQAEQWLPYPVETVFAFFAMPENLPRISPPWQKLQIEEAMFRAPPPRPASAFALRSFAAGPGTKLTLTLRPFPYSPMRLPWYVRITEFDWNEYFCDEQEEGPFRYFKQWHRTLPQTQGEVPGTLLRDTVEFALPLEPVSTLFAVTAMPLILKRMFRYRHRRTLELLAKFAPSAKAI